MTMKLFSKCLIAASLSTALAVVWRFEVAWPRVGHSTRRIRPLSEIMADAVVVKGRVTGWGRPQRLDDVTHSDILYSPVTIKIESAFRPGTLPLGPSEMTAWVLYGATANGSTEDGELDNGPNAIPRIFAMDEVNGTYLIRSGGILGIDGQGRFCSPFMAERCLSEAQISSEVQAPTPVTRQAALVISSPTDGGGVAVSLSVDGGVIAPTGSLCAGDIKRSDTPNGNSSVSW